MENQSPEPQQVTDVLSSEEDEASGVSRQLPRLVFAIASIGFLAFLAIGSIEARIWRFGRLYFENRSVREVWTYLGDRLPGMPGQPVFTALFWTSVVVMVVGTIVGLWYFLSTDEDDSVSDAAITRPDTNATHA